MKSHPYMKQVFVFLIAITIFSCGKDKIKKGDPDTAVPGNFAEAKTELNKIYGKDDNAAQVMDIYLPANRSASTTKVILLLHGGAWALGDKNGNDDDPYIKILLDSVRKRYPDWAIFNMNYRLATFSGKNVFPALENDMATAVKYIYDNRQAFGISDKWVFMGMSAGAHMALLQAYKNNSPIRPKAVVDFYGPTDMTGLYNFHRADGDLAPLIEKLMSGTPSSNAALYNSSSPINFVNAQSPPTLIMHGGKDDTVPEAQSLALSTKLKAAGVATVYGDYYSFPYQTHGWSDPALWKDTMRLIDDFLTTNVP